MFSKLVLGIIAHVLRTARDRGACIDCVVDVFCEELGLWTGNFDEAAFRERIG
jgi:hypothetical protein